VSRLGPNLLPTTSPNANEVHLWSIELTAPLPQALGRARSALRPAEREALERVGAVLQPARRERLTLARGALRIVLGHYLELDPRHVALVRDRGGKPRLRERPELVFSFSHCATLAMVALASRATVGLDVEALGRAGVRRRVYRRALGAEGARVLLSLPEGLRESVFLRHWTAREAFGKALGLPTGLYAPEASVCGVPGVPMLAGKRAGGFSLEQCVSRADTVGAVVLDGGPFQVRHFDYSRAF
jgi:4'-phosphopantetheinyl transferase